MEIQKFEYLENKKSFLDEVKNIFHKKTFFIKISFRDSKILLISRIDSFPIIFTGTKFAESKQNSQSLWNLISVKINSLKVTNW